MVGLVRYTREKGRTPPRVSYVCGVSLLEVTLHEPPGSSPRRVKKRLERLEQTLRRAGVGRVILSRDFPYAHGLCHVTPLGPETMYRALADVLALGWLEAHGVPARAGRVALAAPRLCPELKQAAERLCPAVRSVRIDVPGEEGGWFARQLQREWGMPILPQGAPVDLTVSFGPAGEGAQLCLWGDEPDLAGLELRAGRPDLPPELAPSLLTLLWEAGQVGREDIYAVQTG